MRVEPNALLPSASCQEYSGPCEDSCLIHHLKCHLQEETALPRDSYLQPYYGGHVRKSMSGYLSRDADAGGLSRRQRC